MATVLQGSITGTEIAELDCSLEEKVIPGCIPHRVCVKQIYGLEGESKDKICKKKTAQQTR
jgi:hypothetical protein